MFQVSQMSPQEQTLLLVEWVDSFINSGWLGVEEAEAVRPMQTTSVGILVKRTDTELLLAQSQDETGRTFGSVLAIPARAITAVAYLAEEDREENGQEEK